MPLRTLRPKSSFRKKCREIVGTSEGGFENESVGDHVLGVCTRCGYAFTGVWRFQSVASSRMHRAESD
eukprot:1687169-Rhodomonas_salina.2